MGGEETEKSECFQGTCIFKFLQTFTSVLTYNLIETWKMLSISLESTLGKSKGS